MIFADKVFDPRTGQLFFDPFNLDGWVGDKDTVNGVIQPYLEVKRRKYRFRFLVGGPSRVYEFFLSNGQYFFQLSSDGNLLPRPLTRRSMRLQVAERVDVIVDFSKAALGEKIYLQNRLEQLDGRAPTGKIIAPKNLVEFRVVGDAQDDSRVPVTLLDLPNRNVPIAKTRTWKFDRSNGAWTVNGRLFDPDVFSATIKQNSAEIWTFESGGGWVHPGHPHMEEFQILDRDGKPPPAWEIGRKDMVGVGDAVFGTDNASRVRIFLQFRDWLGDYPMHCHNTVHEDHAMMILFNVVA
jgi:FtsP/CotA-like multicopper oxidase with cupredoxin domain